MKKRINWKNALKIGALCLPFLMNMNVNAESKGTLEFVGENNYYQNSQFYQDIDVANVSGNINVIGGKVNILDNNCIMFDRIEVLRKDTGSYLNKFMFATFDDEISTNTKLLRVYFKASSNVCSTNIYLERPTISFIDNTSILPENISKTINVIPMELSKESSFSSIEDKDNELIQINNINNKIKEENKEQINETSINSKNDKKIKPVEIKKQNDIMNKLSNNIKLVIKLLNDILY